MFVEFSGTKLGFCEFFGEMTRVSMHPEKFWKVMELEYNFFQAWKVMEMRVGHEKSWKSDGI
jgi:hypothetical protein